MISYNINPVNDEGYKQKIPMPGTGISKFNACYNYSA